MGAAHVHLRDTEGQCFTFRVCAHEHIQIQWVLLFFKGKPLKSFSR